MDNIITPVQNKFTKYQVFIIAILAFTQFTVIIDFMVLSPLGAELIPKLHLTSSQFSLVVSAYAFSAGISGLLAAGFADKFDRKKLLVFFYSGFIIGTVLCGIAPDYEYLLMARVVTGIFGGVIASVSFAIITDLFSFHFRGRVMGFVQMAFAASQVLGIPAGLYLANHFGWHFPFLMIAAVSALVAIIIVIYMQPINEHLKIRSEKTAIEHLGKIISTPDYLKAFAATTLLATGGYMLMPFGADFSVNNLGISKEQLPFLYLVTGLFSMVTGPLAGKISDKIGKFKMFCIGSGLAMAMVLIYTHLGVTPFWIILVLNVILFAGILSRMIPASALMTAVPDPQDRGGFMSVNSSIQQISGGIASIVAGLIVYQGSNGLYENYEILGYVVVISMVITIIMMYRINKMVAQKQSASSIPPKQ